MQRVRGVEGQQGEPLRGRKRKAPSHRDRPLCSTFSYKTLEPLDARGVADLGNWRFSYTKVISEGGEVPDA